MPLARYFYFVGGVLLALLFILDACFPKLPVLDRGLDSSLVIRIHSERKWPERIVFDTSLPASVPARIASSGPVTAPPETTGDASGKANGREAFAQMQPSDARLSQPANPKKREPKLQHKSRIARKYTPSHYTSAPQWQLGWYGQGLWRGG